MFCPNTTNFWNFYNKVLFFIENISKKNQHNVPELSALKALNLIQVIHTLMPFLLLIRVIILPSRSRVSSTWPSFSCTIRSVLLTLEELRECSGKNFHFLFVKAGDFIIWTSNISLLPLPFIEYDEFHSPISLQLAYES